MYTRKDKTGHKRPTITHICSIFASSLHEAASWIWGENGEKTWTRTGKLGQRLPVRSPPRPGWNAKTHQQRLSTAERWRSKAQDSLRWLLPALSFWEISRQQTSCYRTLMLAAAPCLWAAVFEQANQSAPSPGGGTSASPECRVTIKTKQIRCEVQIKTNN